MWTQDNICKQLSWKWLLRMLQWICVSFALTAQNLSVLCPMHRKDYATQCHHCGPDYDCYAIQTAQTQSRANRHRDWCNTPIAPIRIFASKKHLAIKWLQWNSCIPDDRLIKHPNSRKTHFSRWRAVETGVVAAVAFFSSRAFFWAGAWPNDWVVYCFKVSVLSSRVTSLWSCVRPFQ